MSGSPSWIGELGGLLGPGKVTTDPDRLAASSRDYYWYSPILRSQLEGKTAEAVARIDTLEEMRTLVAFCAGRRVPLTLRGAGTGNYGQSTPLHGGVQADITGFNRILSLQDGVVRGEPGARLGRIEEEARRLDWEMRCYPSTWMKSTLAGFIAGGSGGIGSITHGLIRDGDNLKSLRLLTMEESPRLVTLEEREALAAHFAFGTNGIIVEAELRLAPRRDWDQWAFGSADFDALFSFALELARDESVAKRLVSLHEWPIPSYFRSIAGEFAEGEHTLFTEIAVEHRAEFEARAAGRGLRRQIFIAAHEPRRPPMLSDYCINHTTLWALKADPTLTYLSGQEYDPVHAADQYRALRRALPGEILLHFEIMKRAGRVTVRGLPLVRYTTLDRFREIIGICASLGIPGGAPHTYLLDEKPFPGGFRDIYRLKDQADPYQLLNPGKLKNYHPPTRRADSTPAVVEFSGIEKRFRRGAPVLADISFRVGAGEFVSLLGPSGCGKSTILRLIAGLTPATGGSLQVDGRDPVRARSQIGYIFQEATLLPWLTVKQNVELLLRLRGVEREVREEKVATMLDLVHLKPASDYFPRQLSGGMRMRVSVARALASEPRLLLLDEPFGALDEIARHRLNEELRSLQQTQRWAAVFVTHSVDEAVFLSHRILIMSANPGRIAADIPIDLPEERTAALRETDAYAHAVIRISKALRATFTGDDSR
jgi:ABC-type nitrate/sulfonate/bicarbonate transport system ATPase subunit/FAD/FMN-containing dehydrogenase